MDNTTVLEAMEIFDDDIKVIETFRCAECGYEIEFHTAGKVEEYDYCPKCGKKITDIV